MVVVDKSLIANREAICSILAVQLHLLQWAPTLSFSMVRLLKARNLSQPLTWEVVNSPRQVVVTRAIST